MNKHETYRTIVLLVLLTIGILTIVLSNENYSNNFLNTILDND